MLRKFSMSFLAVAILLTGTIITFAQTAPIRGKVELKKPDGTTAPVENAVIEVYRTDIKAKLPSGKTDKKGQFVFAGLPLGAEMTLAVSAPGIKGDLLPGVKAGREDIAITVYPGDGKPLTEDEVRNAVATTPKQGQVAEETAEQKKAREEAQKKYDEAVEKNKKIEGSNVVIKTSLEEGSKAFQAKNYDLAIAKFDEGVTADPDFAGSATVLNNNKALALRMRAFESYKQGTTDKGNQVSWLEKAKNDFQGSVAASQRTIDLISKITDSIEAKKYDKAKYDAFSNIVEARRLMIATNADTSQPEAAATALEQYLVVETDAAAKLKNQIYVADALRLSGNSGLAVPIYRNVLTGAPENFEALAGLGLCLLNEGEIQGKLDMSQEGLNLMQKFTELAPDSHPLKADVKLAVTYLKDEKKLVPQKMKPVPGAVKGKKP